jgi:hypothetical protein
MIESYLPQITKPVGNKEVRIEGEKKLILQVNYIRGYC